MDKVSNVQEQTPSVSREMEILRKNQKEMLEIKNTISEMKNDFEELLTIWTWLRKESLSLNLQKPLKLKSKKKIAGGVGETEENIQELWNYYKKYNLCAMGILEGEAREQGIEKKNLKQ